MGNFEPSNNRKRVYMNRRELLKSGLWTIGGILPISGILGFKTKRAPQENQGVYPSLKVLLGSLEIFILSDGIISLPAIQPIFAPMIDKSVVDKELDDLHAPIDKIEAGINIMLVRKGERLILFDAGSGHHFGNNGGRLLKSLETLNIKPEQITDIIITHAHIDHIGGILNEQNKVVFTKADYYIAKKEYDFWMAENPDFSKSKGDRASADFNISFARKTLSMIVEHLHFFDYGQTLFSCIVPELAEGHTEGHTIFDIQSDGKYIKHIVDTFHTSFLVSKPEWGTEWDSDFNKAVETRKIIMEEGAKKKTLFMSCHLSWPGLGYIDKTQENYLWSSYPYSNPVSITI